MILDIIIILFFKNICFQIFLSIWTISSTNWRKSILRCTIIFSLHSCRIKKKGKD